MTVNRYVSWIVVVTLLLLVSTPEPSLPQQANEAATGASAPLEPGDALRLSFSREVEFNGDYPVDSRGMVNLPILGEQNVSDLAARELVDSLVIAYDQQIRNQTVQIDWLRRIRILGEVQQPGLYLVDPTMTLLDAVALAGGVSANGKLDGTKVLRDGVEVTSDLNSETLVLEDVRSGDQVMVAQKSWFARNTGLVLGTLTTLTIVVVTSIIRND
jgi:protein involved in polysaccharide export with SLBB domain